MQINKLNETEIKHSPPARTFTQENTKYHPQLTHIVLIHILNVFI